jgi:hypothetical protein
MTRRPLPHYTAYGCPKSPEVWAALARSFGARPVPASSFLDRNTAAIVGGLEYGSDTLLREIRASGHPHVFVDGGYIKARNGSERVLYRLVPNAFLQYWINATRAHDTSRLAALGLTLRPWRKTGGPIVVCGSGSKHHWFFGLERWIEDTVAALRRHTDRPIVVRSYEAAQAGTMPPLAEQLADAWAMVTHTSTAAVEAALLGVPVFVAPENVAAPLGNLDPSRIETPLLSDRTAWAASLAWSQFGVEEIASGLARAVALEAEACRPKLPADVAGWREAPLVQSERGLS